VACGIAQNPELLQISTTGELLAARGRAQTTQENTENWEAKQRQRASVLSLVQEEANLISTGSNSMLKCGKCGGSDVSWDSKQLRSADEGMTIFVQCENAKCRARWKM
jgi:DNA-directed RNA polymerase subunit M/transcription elongation factor TFIIS